MRPNDDVGEPTEPEPPDFETDLEGERRRGSRDLGALPTRDVPEPPNRDDVRPDDVDPDAGTIEPPD